MITFEALAEELGLSTWFASLLMEEAALYAPFDEPRRVLPEGRTASDLSASEWVALPLTDTFAGLIRARYPIWAAAS